jgi:glycosyltransferase involved in cell wall biosynthesis
MLDSSPKIVSRLLTPLTPDTFWLRLFAANSPKRRPTPTPQKIFAQTVLQKSYFTVLCLAAASLSKPRTMSSTLPLNADPGVAAARLCAYPRSAITQAFAKKQVLFIGHYAGRTGAPFVLLHFLRWLREHSEIDFEVLLRHGGELLGDFEAIAPTRVLNRGLIVNGEQSLIVRARRKFGLLPSIAEQIAQYYPRERFPLVYANTVTNGELLSIFSQLGHRTICHAHEMEHVIKIQGGDAAKCAAATTDHFIAASRAVGHDLQRTLQIPAEKISVVHEFGRPTSLSKESQEAARNKIRAELGIGISDMVVGMCGTAGWRKGSDLFALIAKAVLAIHPQQRYVFLWVGVESNSQEYWQMVHDAARLGLNESIKLVAPVPNAEDYLSAMDMLTLTSREDPFPIVMLEAAALGVPVLCFAGTGGGPEFVGSESGAVVPYLDINAMAKAVVSIATNAEWREHLVNTARARVSSEFSLAVQAPKLRDLVIQHLAESIQ